MSKVIEKFRGKEFNRLKNNGVAILIKMSSYAMFGMANVEPITKGIYPCPGRHKII
jgi:hypothetical protein